MVASFLTITLLAGIGFQLRRWLGKQPWYMGVGFVIFLYVPAFIGAVAGLSAIGTPIDAALIEVPGPVFGGLLLGAYCLCSSGALLPGAVEEILRTEEARDSKERGVDSKSVGKSSETPENGTTGERARQAGSPRTQIVTITGLLCLLGVLVVVFRVGGIGLGESVGLSTRAEEESVGQKMRTREVQAELSGLPSSATLTVPYTFKEPKSPLQKAKEDLILAAWRSNDARQSTYSKLLARDWTKNLRATTLSIGQLGSLREHQGGITSQQWRAILEKSQGMSDPTFQRRVDSLQSVMEAESNVPGFTMSAPAVTVRDGSLIVYKTVEVRRQDEDIRQLTARKVMYDSGYSVFVDIAMSASGGAPLDSLSNYVRATSFSAD